MLLAFALLLTQTDISRLDQLAASKDLASLSNYLAATSKSGQPFNIIKSEGAYGVGRYGWHAKALEGINGKQYVVFSTPLTSQDTGELLFALEDGKLSFVHESETFGVHIRRHKFDLNFKVHEKKALVTDDLELSIEASGGDYGFFRMSPCYKVTALSTASGEAVSFAQAGGVVQFKKPASGNSHLKVEYAGVVDLPGFAASINDQEATLTNDYWYPMIARKPAPYEITVHAPKGWRIIAQGIKQSEVQSDSESKATYKMDLPCVFYSLSAAKYQQAEFVENGFKSYAWSRRLPMSSLSIQSRLIPQVLNFYSSKFGKIPFPSWGALDTELYGGGALEAYSFASYGGGVPGEDAHEPAHTWWGGILNNTYLKSFWNESFAVFSDGLYHREGGPGNLAARRKAFVSDSSAEESYNEASCAESGANLGGIGSALGYGKGAKVLQMLEQLIGTPEIIDVMKTWAEKDKGKEVSWEDFETVLYQKVSGGYVKEFMKQWIHKPGFAVVDFGKPSFEAGQVLIPTKFAAGSCSYFPLEVYLEYPNGKSATVTVKVMGLSTTKVPSTTKPSRVVIDPWKKLLTEHPGEEPQTAATAFSVKAIVQKGKESWATGFGVLAAKTTMKQIAGKVLVGTPETWPALRDITDKAGIKVKDDRLTFGETTVNLDKGGAAGFVDTPDGKVYFLLGKAALRPELGHAKIAVFDELGRFLDGVTEPVLQGKWAFRLN